MNKVDYLPQLDNLRVERRSQRQNQIGMEKLVWGKRSREYCLKKLINSGLV